MVSARLSWPPRCCASTNASRVVRETTGTTKRASGRASAMRAAASSTRPACISISESRLPGNSAKSGAAPLYCRSSRTARRVPGPAASAECVVLQEAYADTETASFADVLLPSSTWGETDGTVTNSERRISRVRAAVAPPGEARDDWAIVCDFARRLDPDNGARLFPYASAEAVFDEHRETTRGRDLDITGLSWALLEQAPQQWPFPAGATAGRARLYTDGIYPTPSGRARFHAAPYRPVAEAIDARYPLHLNTGRLRDQWHAMSRSGKVPRLFAHADAPRLAMNPRDLDLRRLRAGNQVRVKR